MTTAMSPTSTSVTACALEDLTPELGVAVLCGEIQVALFRLSDDSVYAVQNLCPFSGAQVISRGITGSKGDIPTIASPVYKQVFSLVDGTCLATMDKEPRAGLSAKLVTYAVTVDNGHITIDLTGGT